MPDCLQNRRDFCSSYHLARPKHFPLACFTFLCCRPVFFFLSVFSRSVFSLLLLLISQIIKFLTSNLKFILCFFIVIFYLALVCR
uniref:Uncharacterized protein n=1 Tax=Oryza brachyantha TaxID=4533 RepID=J3N030_ORYBR